MRRLLAAALPVASALTVAAAPLLVAAPASAAGSAGVQVTNDRGTKMADAKYRTKLTITGRNFQVVKGGFGGVYVMFGSVRDPGGGSWRPSRGGITGEDYRYVPDSETANNQGYLKFIAFPGSSTEAEAQAVFSSSGRFTIGLTVPGPTFRSVDRDGRPQEVDCRKVRCGVITIGAHGVTNANNETFTPVKFGNVYGSRTPTAGRGDGRRSPVTTRTAGPSRSTPVIKAPVSVAPRTAPSSAPAATAPVVTPKVTADRSTARAGNVLAFTGVGFRPGETVVGVLDDGAVGVGPLVAGTAGDVAGVLRLPRNLEAGTHELRLSGAMSGTRAGDRFPVQAAARTTTATVPVAKATNGPSASLLLLIAAAVVLALVGGAVGRRRLLRHRMGAS